MDGSVDLFSSWVNSMWLKWKTKSVKMELQIYLLIRRDLTININFLPTIIQNTFLVLGQAPLLAQDL